MASSASLIKPELFRLSSTLLLPLDYFMNTSNTHEFADTLVVGEVKFYYQQLLLF